MSVTVSLKVSPSFLPTLYSAVTGRGPDTGSMISAKGEEQGGAQLAAHPRKFGGRTWEEHIEATRESSQLTFDWMKHMSTLSLGSILAISGFFKALFPEPEQIWLLFVALASLAGTVAGTLFAMLYAIVLRVPPEVVAYETQEAANTRLSTRKAYAVFLTLAIILFLIGIGAFVVFTVTNAL